MISDENERKKNQKALFFSFEILINSEDKANKSQSSLHVFFGAAQRKTL